MKKVNNIKNRNKINKSIFAKVLVVAILCFSIFALAGCGKDGEIKKFKVLEETLDSEEYGVGFRMGDVKLGLAVSDALAEMALDSTGEEISMKWFGEDILMKDAPLLNTENIRKTEDQSLEKVQKAGKLVMGLDDSFPPMGYRDEENNIVGFDIDLAKEVAKRLGVELVLQPIDWNAKEMELATNKIDCVWNGMSVTPKRLATMYIPRSYVANRQIIIVPEDSTIAAIADLEGKTVGLQKGSSSLDALNKNEINSKIKALQEYPDNVAAFLDLKTGRIDALIVDEVVGLYLISDGKANKH